MCACVCRIKTSPKFCNGKIKTKNIKLNWFECHWVNHMHLIQFSSVTMHKLSPYTIYFISIYICFNLLFHFNWSIPNCDQKKVFKYFEWFTHSPLREIKSVQTEIIHTCMEIQFMQKFVQHLNSMYFYFVKFHRFFDRIVCRRPMELVEFVIHLKSRAHDNYNNDFHSNNDNAHSTIFHTFLVN